MLLTFLDRSDDGAAGLSKGSLVMKLRNLLLAVVALAVLAGSVTPAQAARRHHHKKVVHHRHHKK